MKYSTLIFILTASILIVPLTVLGQEKFVPMVGIPGVPTEAVGIEPYINALFLLAIAAAGILAVVKIISSGMKYMFSEIVTSKEDAKKDIQGAVLGLLLILGGVTILNEINPNLSTFDALQKAGPVTVQGGAISTNSGSNIGDEASTTEMTPEQQAAFTTNCAKAGNTTVRENGKLVCKPAGSMAEVCPEGQTWKSAGTSESGMQQGSCEKS